MVKLTSTQRSEISKRAWGRRKPKAVCQFCGRKIWARGVKSPTGRPMHKSCYEAFHAGLKPAQVGKNPPKGTKKCPICGTFSEYRWQAGGWYCPKCRKWFFPSGLNPRRITERRRVPRDAFSFGAKPLNPKFQFGPTGFRPPAKWFAKMAQGSAASYFGKKLKDLTASQKAKVGQIVGGIWAKYTDATRMKILKKYEPSAVRANPKSLACPACGTMNPIGPMSVYLRCSGCGAQLAKVNVRKRK